MERAIARGDVAAAILETIPATYGFPMPEPGYLQEVKRLCERHGTLFIADEVQTGLMRTGEMWAIYGYGVEPDILVTAKGISGGIYPIACTILNEASSAWLEEDGWGHVSTGGGSELGCVVALKVLEITQRAPVVSMVHAASALFAERLAEIQLARAGVARRRAPERPRHGARAGPSRGREAAHRGICTRTACGRSSRRSTRASCSSSPACS